MGKTHARVLASMVALAASSLAGAGSAPFAAAPDAEILWDQFDQDTGVGVVSQNFEPVYDAYDAQGADDFEVPEGEAWIIKKVHIKGTYFASFGPAVSENVFFYRHGGKVPGAVIKSYMGLVGKDEMGWGWFIITLPEPLKLKPGRHWLSVQVNMDFETSGEWGLVGRAVQRGKPAVWKNPGGGFGLGCTEYRPQHECFDLGQGPDYAFALIGTRKVLP